MNTPRRRACFLAAALGLCVLGSPNGFAQDEELGRLGDQRERGETGAIAETPAERPTSEPRTADEEAVPTEASKAPPSRAIEEIVVTAQRREEQLRDVPISMSAFDAEFLSEQGLTDLQDVSRYVPNVRFSQAGGTIEPRIRGFSTLTIVNRGLELPVGIAIDEVPYSRSDYFVSGLFDVDRVEVLRGAQGQLFGANTTVGLVNLTTKNPTDELTGFIDGQVGELDSRRFEGAVGGPLVPEFLNFRIAGLWDERDGYVRNTTAAVVPEADEIFGGRLRRSGRVKLGFPNLFGGDLALSYQRDSLDFTATPRELTVVPQKWRSLFLQYDPNTDFTPNNLVGSLDSASFNKSDLNTFTARGRFDLGSWGLNVVGGFADLKGRTLDDADSTPTPQSVSFVEEASRQTTFEFRVTSPDLAGFFGIGRLLGMPLGSTDFTSGFFFQRRTLSPVDVTIHFDGLLLLLGQALTPLPDELVPAIPRPPPDVEVIANQFEQTANEFAGFGQMNWRFLDRWTLLYGMRLSYVTKDASTIQQVTGPILPQVVDSFVNENQRNREFHFSPKVGMKYDWTDDLNLYWSWSTGFQAGGFNNFGTSADPATRSIKPANVRDWEAGTKMRFLGGAAELSLGLFWMTMTDFQLFTTGPDPGSAFPVAGVINVGELRARGVEADSIWLPTEWLTLRAALGFNDNEYVEFPVGSCFLDRPDTDGDGDPRCDLSGRPLNQAPKWDVTVTPSVRVPLTSIPGFGAISPSFLREVDLTQALTVQYTDNMYLNDTDDPRTRQPSVFKLDANVGFGNASQGWSLQLRVENLTDERTHNTAFEAIPYGGTVYKAPEPPRLIYGGFRWRF